MGPVLTLQHSYGFILFVYFFVISMQYCKEVINVSFAFLDIKTKKKKGKNFESYLVAKEWDPIYMCDAPVVG